MAAGCRSTAVAARRAPSAGDPIAGGGVLYSSDRWLNNYETAKVDGYTRVDATVAWLQPSYELRLNLQNLNDREYFEGSSAGRATPVRPAGACVS